ncbi:hypothetical protein GYMLUDRAFT_509850 [Collybiopsis luxurians FD-317 M1]|nr:hypothetical protein GYMLUDRAFT_509850 [Collybiopsis luxurians FD-317 M1]
MVSCFRFDISKSRNHLWEAVSRSFIYCWKRRLERSTSVSQAARQFQWSNKVIPHRIRPPTAMRSFPWFLLLTFSARVFCALVNITIDDIDPRIQYSPAGAWNARNSSQNCSTCPSQVEPNPSEMFSHTWHEGLFSPIPGVTNFTNMPLFLNMTFNGTAVYVFGALAQSTAAVPVAYDMGFYIDNRLRYTFSQSGENLNSSYEYNICLFAISDLALGDHTLVLQNGQPNATESLVLLDYIVYTYVLKHIPHFV